MKRTLFAIFSLILMLTSCQEEIKPNDKGIFKVTPSELVFNAKKGHQDITVKTSSKPWEIVVPEGVEWVHPERLSGRFSQSLAIYVDKNATGAERTAFLDVKSEGFEPIKLLVKQGATNADPTPMEDVFPDPESGIYVDPKKPDADGPCTIHFEAPASSPLYNETSDLYVHIGLIADEAWQFVPSSSWEENLDKCKMTKVEDNHWTLELGPTIREYFGSGETPVVRLAMVIRNADATKKAYPEDQFNSCTDKKYVYVPFQPDDVEVESMPAGLKTGINYNDDKTVTFVLYDKDKAGKHYDYCYLIGEFSQWERQSKYMMKRDADASCWWYTLPASEIEPGKEYLFQYHVGNSKKHFRLTDPYTEIVYDSWNDKYISTSTYPDLTPYPEGTRDLVGAFQVDRPQYNWKHDNFKVKDINDLVIYEMLFRDFTSTGDIKGAMAELDYIQNLGVNAIEVMPIQEFDGNDSWGYNPNHYFALDKAYGTREMYKEFIDECHARGIAVIVDVVYNHVSGNHPMAKLYWNKTSVLESNPWFNVVAPHPFSVEVDWNHENMQTRDHVKRSLEYLLKEYKVDGFRFDLTKGFTQRQCNEGNAGNYDQSRIDILTDYYNKIKSVKSDAVMILEHFCDFSEEKALAEKGMKVWRKMNDPYMKAALGDRKGDFNGLWVNGDNNMPFGSCVGFMESHDEERIAFKLKGQGGGIIAQWGLCGTMTNWGDAPDNTKDINFVRDGSLQVIKGLKLKATDQFKVRGDNSWKVDQNILGAAQKNGEIIPLDKAYTMTRGGGSKNMSVAADGKYDIYFHQASGRIWIVAAGGKKPEVAPDPEGAWVPYAMKRSALNAAFFLTVPGPKMIWQFGELGYDISIDENGRTGRKPVLWEYEDVPARKQLYDVYAGLLKFRKDNPEFFRIDASFSWSVGSNNWPGRYILCDAGNKSFAIVGNFGDHTENLNITLHSDGTWYDYFDRSKTYSGSSHNFDLQPGEFKMLVNF